MNTPKSAKMLLLFSLFLFMFKYKCKNLKYIILFHIQLDYEIITKVIINIKYNINGIQNYFFFASNITSLV